MIQPAFLSTLQVAKLPGRQWRLLAPLRYQSAVLGTLIEVPTGFLSDLASVPRLPLAYLLAGDTAHEAAVVHDYLYQVRISTRAQADAVLAEAMAVTGEEAVRKALEAEPDVILMDMRLQGDMDGAEAAARIIEGMVEEPEIGKEYDGVVKRIMDFGAFVEILPGKEGLCHISKLSRTRIATVTEVVKEGQHIPVKVLEVDKMGRLNLSYIDAIDGGSEEDSRPPRREDEGRRDRGRN